jgi:hypothetical protein
LPRGRQAPTPCYHGGILVLYERSGLSSPRTTNIRELERKITETVIPVTCDITRRKPHKERKANSTSLGLLMPGAVKLIGSRRRFYRVSINYRRILQNNIFTNTEQKYMIRTSRQFQRHYQNCESASTPQSGTSHKTCLRGFGRNGSIA